MPIRKIKNPYNFSHCRFCSHYFLSHTSMADGTNFCEWGNGIYNPTKCECTDFAPEDNLDYLEWKYEQLGKSTSRKSTTNK